MNSNLSEKALMAFIYSSLFVLMFVTLYPFWNAIVISFNTGHNTALGGLSFWPRDFTMKNYQVVLRDSRLLDAFVVTALRTVVGTVLSIFFTSLFAYGLSKKELIGRKYYMVICVITMYFSGGLIPTFLLIRELHLMNTFWVMVIPGIISVWNMIIFRTFFIQLPEGLEESAKMDGCNHHGVFFRIVLPISGPVVATLSLFTAVWHWNSWFDASIYITNPKLLPIQTLLSNIVNSNLVSESSQFLKQTTVKAIQQANIVTYRSLLMTTMVISTIPVLVVFPFVQKYFSKGVLVGSLKE
ncbi:carbohydrate ABC transporter permease [Paenibacillus sp. LHD-117]|uniref:carbohydrate ABC transporter permease n=1 Tax=Paenibacillus sp. LHD-117 TaxID=3071412 RepID=UPI0027E059F0|nr:carbohydrate ABC transporter permease [Paenibacillus sp. LHD-117]MDQ6422963.1 carbohydrate ABC transporter permease [Paenibacillus sp. LHD-117]